MLAAAVLCPHPPLLVPELAAGAAGEADELRVACDRAVARGLAAGPARVVVVGPGPTEVDHGPGAWGSTAGHGPDVAVTLPGGARTPGGPTPGARTPGVPAPGAEPGGQPRPNRGAGLPLSLTIGAWLLTRAGWTGPTSAHALAAERSPERCARLGERLTTGPPTFLLAMGDASARRSVRAPGYFDARSEPFDRTVADAFGRGDTAALMGLDAGLARELMAAGRPAWQVLAGAAARARVNAEVLYDEAPYGVGYLVVSWLPGDAGGSCPSGRAPEGSAKSSTA